MTALDAVLASVAKGGRVVSIVPVDGEEREALLTELVGICESQSPVDRNGDCRFIGTEPDGAEWRVALLAVPRKPRTAESVMVLWNEHLEIMAALRGDFSCDARAARVLSRHNAEDLDREIHDRIL